MGPRCDVLLVQKEVRWSSVPHGVHTDQPREKKSCLFHSQPIDKMSAILRPLAKWYQNAVGKELKKYGDFLETLKLDFEAVRPVLFSSLPSGQRRRFFLHSTQ
jgi:hypothetical protein